MKKHLNKFSIFVWFAIQFSSLASAMEQPPLTPRTHAIIALSQQLKSHEETIALLCQARSQDMQLAQLRESKLEKQLDEIRKELQLTKQAIPCIMPVVDDEQSDPDSQKSLAVLLLKQAGSKGALIAQAIITRHYVCQVLQTLIQKTKFTPRVKALLNNATPEIANLAAGASVYATARLVEQAPKAIGLFASIRQTLGSVVWFRPDCYDHNYKEWYLISATPEESKNSTPFLVMNNQQINKVGLGVAAAVGIVCFCAGRKLPVNHELEILHFEKEMLQAWEICIKCLKDAR